MENLIYQITNEIKCLDAYVNAMKKVENSKPVLEDLENLQMHINNLKAWAGIDVETNANSLHKHSVMPSLHTFKERRDKLNLTLRQVAKQTNVSAATISRIERGEGECSYHNVVQLDDYYCRNGA